MRSGPEKRGAGVETVAAPFGPFRGRCVPYRMRTTRASTKVCECARRSRKGGRRGLNEVTEREKARKEAARALLGTVSCIVGILFAILGASNNVSAGAIGAALGILGYFLQQFANR